MILANPPLVKDFERLSQYNIRHFYLLIFVLTQQTGKPYSLVGDDQ
jgi:hypothetical protein